MNQRFIIFSVLMGSYFGFYLALPLFPTIFLNDNYSFLPKEMGEGLRNILLGLSYTVYCVGGFIGTPLMGKLSDRVGRKPILSITLLLSAITYILSACSIYFSLFALLLFARFFTGFFDSSYSLAYTILIDIDKNSNKKLPNIEFWTTIASTCGWILGSLIGWNMAANPSFPLALLFWGAFFLDLIFFFLVFFFLKESQKALSPKENTKNPFLAVILAFKHPSLKPVLISNSLFYAATFIFSYYIPIFLMNGYNFDPASLGTVDTCLSCAACLAPFTYWLFTKYGSRKDAICISSLGITFALLVLILLPFKCTIWTSLFLASYFTAVGWSFSTFLITDYSSYEEQGEALGVNQALFVLTEAIASFCCGIFAAIWFYLPFIAAIICALFSASWIFYAISRPLNNSLQE